MSDFKKFLLGFFGGSVIGGIGVYVLLTPSTPDLTDNGFVSGGNDIGLVFPVVFMVAGGLLALASLILLIIELISKSSGGLKRFINLHIKR
jgi:hypothetical protein